MRTEEIGQALAELVECDAYFGEVVTGRTEVHWGYFVRIISPSGEFWGKDRHSLYDAFHAASKIAEVNGWTVVALGRLPQFRETGLSVNSGYGLHPAIPDRHVHMSEPPPDEQNS
jgi:hypothetical protein